MASIIFELRQPLRGSKVSWVSNRILSFIYDSDKIPLKYQWIWISNSTLVTNYIRLPINIYRKIYLQLPNKYLDFVNNCNTIRTYTLNSSIYWVIWSLVFAIFLVILLSSIVFIILSSPAYNFLFWIYFCLSLLEMREKPSKKPTKIGW